jgi:5'-3' exoribonuclease 1
VLTLAPDLTPTGTPFMARLSQHLQYFVNKKISEDAEWRGVEIILSGHDVRAPRLCL